MTLPLEGTVFISVNDLDKSAAVKLARDLHHLGFSLVATAGTAAFLEKAGVPVETLRKLHEPSPNVVDYIREGKINLIINTPLGARAYDDGTLMRSLAYQNRIPIMTTLSAAQATVQAIRALRTKTLRVRSLQTHHRVSP
jgi:carbamoyl-phosphate synthase large subunit